MFPEETDALLYAFITHKDPTVFVPLKGFLSRSADGFQYRITALRVGQYCRHTFGLKSVAFRHLTNKFTAFRCFIVGTGL